jgi:hypothetical protein
MIKQVKNIFLKYVVRHADNSGSLYAAPEIIQAFKKDPENPFLISFPRTGSHWLRMLMELYFEKPGLVRIFYYKTANSFTCLHTHDLELDIERSNVIYLYREPIDTVFSQLSYHKENINDSERIRYWAERYGKHLSKWLFEETFTAEKAIITYEGLKKDLESEFRKICIFFKTEFDSRRLAEVAGQVSRETLKDKTLHDTQVVNLFEAYPKNRELFHREQGGFVLECFLSQNSRLSNLFKDSYE